MVVTLRSYHISSDLYWQPTAQNMGAYKQVNIQGHLAIVGALLTCIFTLGFVLELLKMLKTVSQVDGF